MEGNAWFDNAVVVIRRTLWQSTPIIILAVSLPILSYFLPIRPEVETVASWFQRSGSLVVLFGVWLEVKCYKIDGYINPSGMSSSMNRDLKNKFGAWYTLVRSIGVLLAVTGTLIWGYGDILVGGT